MNVPKPPKDVSIGMHGMNVVTDDALVAAFRRAGVPDADMEWWVARAKAKLVDLGYADVSIEDVAEAN